MDIELLANSKIEAIALENCVTSLLWTNKHQTLVKV